MTPTIIDSTDRLHLEVDKNMKITSAVIETEQEIPDWFLTGLADQRTAQGHLFAPEELQICSLPGAVVDKWFREGFSIWDPNIRPADIVKRLSAETRRASGANRP